MKKLYFLLFTLISFTGMAQQDITNNGSFENFTGTTPDDWTTIDSGITTAEETTIVSEGAKSLKVTVTTGSQGNTDFRQTVDVTNGITYDVSVDIYQVGGDNDARARFFVGGNYANYSVPATVDSWQTISTTYTATATESIEVGLRFYDVAGFDGSSVIYVDNYKVIDPTVLSVEESKFAKFSVFPNPTNTGFVNIKTSNNETTQVAVYDVLGKQVISQTLNNNRLNVSNLNSGLYILKLSQNGATTTKKLVVK